VQEVTRQNATPKLTDAQREEVIEAFAEFALEQKRIRNRWHLDTARKYGVPPYAVRHALVPRAVAEREERIRKVYESEANRYRDERREMVASLLESTDRDLLDEDAGEYGVNEEGGPGWVSSPAINKTELVEFVLDTLEFMRSVR